MSLIQRDFSHTRYMCYMPKALCLDLVKIFLVQPNRERRDNSKKQNSLRTLSWRCLIFFSPMLFFQSSFYVFPASFFSFRGGGKVGGGTNIWATAHTPEKKAEKRLGTYQFLLFSFGKVQRGREYVLTLTLCRQSTNNEIYENSFFCRLYVSCSSPN